MGRSTQHGEASWEEGQHPLLAPAGMGAWKPERHRKGRRGGESLECAGVRNFSSFLVCGLFFLFLLPKMLTIKGHEHPFGSRKRKLNALTETCRESLAHYRCCRQNAKSHAPQTCSQACVPPEQPGCKRNEVSHEATQRYKADGKYGDGCDSGSSVARE